MTCAHCEDLAERIAWLESELGERDDIEATYALARGLKINPGAAKMLARMHAAKGHYVSSVQLMEATSRAGFDDDRDPKLVSVRVWQLRRAMGKDSIQTAYGHGYSLAPEALARVSQILGAAPAGLGRVLAHRSTSRGHNPA